MIAAEDEAAPRRDRVARATGRQPLQKRAQRTRSALLAAAEAVAAVEGETAVTTSRIAAETGVAVGTIYRYFPDRDALLLAAYDATVARIVERCHSALEALDAAMRADDAARTLLGVYLDAADALPGHCSLLRAMRRIRPIERGQGVGEDRVTNEILAPFLRRFLPGGGATDTEALRFLGVLLGTLVDLYLITEDGAARRRLRGDIEAHMLLALRRIGDDASRAGRLP